MIPEKQIKEMAKIIRNANGKGYPDNYFIADAKVLYRAGYRKASDVAEEIFDDIERLMFANVFFTLEGKYYHKELKDCIAELKKKYTQEK